MSFISSKLSLQVNTGSCNFLSQSISSAAIATGMLKDLINAGELPKKKIHPAVDAKKVFGHKEKVMKQSVNTAMKRLDEDRVERILFGSKLDKTKKVLTFNDETIRFHSKTIEKEHYTCTSYLGTIREMLVPLSPRAC